MSTEESMPHTLAPVTDIAARGYAHPEALGHPGAGAGRETVGDRQIL